MPSLEDAIDDCLQAIAADQRKTTGRKPVRSLYEDLGRRRELLRIQTVAEARGQIRRNEEAAKRRRRHVTAGGNGRPTTLVSSQHARPAQAATLEAAVDELLSAYDEKTRKRGESPRARVSEMLLSDEDARALLVDELNALIKESPWKKAKKSKSISKGMR